MDRRLCGHLSAARDVVGIPLGFVTEFHGWSVLPHVDNVTIKSNTNIRWHVFTGIGVYFYVVFIEYLRLYIAPQSKTTQENTITLVWPTRISLPRLELIPSTAF